MLAWVIHSLLRQFQHVKHNKGRTSGDCISQRAESFSSLHVSRANYGGNHSAASLDNSGIGPQYSARCGCSHLSKRLCEIGGRVWCISPWGVELRSISPGLDQPREAQYGFRMRLRAWCKEETFFCLEKMRLVSHRRGLLVQRIATSAAVLSNDIVSG